MDKEKVNTNNLSEERKMIISKAFISFMLKMPEDVANNIKVKDLKEVFEGIMIDTIELINKK